MLINVKKGKHEHKFDEYKRRQLAQRDARKQEDIMKGLNRPKGAQRGDFKFCREQDKVIMDYRKFKDPKDREKIKQEYFRVEKEWRNA